MCREHFRTFLSQCAHWTHLQFFHAHQRLSDVMANPLRSFRLHTHAASTGQLLKRRVLCRTTRSLDAQCGKAGVVQRQCKCCCCAARQLRESTHIFLFFPSLSYRMLFSLPRSVVVTFAVVFQPPPHLACTYLDNMANSQHFFALY